jgi:hypothetical protein
MCTVLLPPAVNQIAVNKYIISNIIIKMRKTLRKRERREEDENGGGSRRNLDKTQRSDNEQHAQPPLPVLCCDSAQCIPATCCHD